MNEYAYDLSEPITVQTCAGALNWELSFLTLAIQPHDNEQLLSFIEAVTYGGIH